MAPLFNPRTDVWREHFRWSNDFGWIIGETAVGRATVTRLDINLPGSVSMRELIARAGTNFPPTDTLPEDFRDGFRL